MATAPRLTSTGLSAMSDIEDVLATRLRETVDELAHADCLDEEQRAEVYAILQALRADSEIHRRLVSGVVSRLGEYVSDAE